LPLALRKVNHFQGLECFLLKHRRSLVSLPWCGASFRRVSTLRASFILTRPDKRKGILHLSRRAPSFIVLPRLTPKDITRHLFVVHRAQFTTLTLMDKYAKAKEVAKAKSSPALGNCPALRSHFMCATRAGNHAYAGVCNNSCMPKQCKSTLVREFTVVIVLMMHCLTLSAKHSIGMY
jgi:hypothetical protein